MPRLPRRSGAAPRASQATNPSPRAPPSTISATPATQNDGRCEFVPRLPRRSGAAPRASQATNSSPRAPPSTISATPATQNDGRCEFVPRLPRDIKVDVTKCHACHAEVARRPGRHRRQIPAQGRHPVP